MSDTSPPTRGGRLADRYSEHYWNPWGCTPMDASGWSPRNLLNEHARVIDIGNFSEPAFASLYRS